MANVTETSSSDLDQVTFRSMREVVADMLRKSISDGTLKPGEALMDTILAKKLNISRGPVREALLQLEKEYLVRNVHHKGWYVIELTAEEVQEIISLRAVLEVLALKLARNQATATDIVRLSALQEELKQCVRLGDGQNFHRIDFQFHRQIWQLARHRRLEETLSKLVSPYFAYIQTMLRSLNLPMSEYTSTLNTHQDLIDFLAGRSDLTAEECIAAHLAPLKIINWDQLLKLSMGQKLPLS